MQMKASGLYVSRSLGFQDAEFEEVKVELSESQLQLYDQAVGYPCPAVPQFDRLPHESTIAHWRAADGSHPWANHPTRRPSGPSSQSIFQPPLRISAWRTPECGPPTGVATSVSSNRWESFPFRAPQSAWRLILLACLYEETSIASRHLDTPVAQR